jgi:hypothetical protein
MMKEYDMIQFIACKGAHPPLQMCPLALNAKIRKSRESLIAFDGAAKSASINLLRLPSCTV